MKIEFFTPSAAHSAGGIDRAIRGFEEALRDRHQIDFKRDGTPGEKTELVHFHGLWNRHHLAAYSHCRRHRIPYIISPHGMLEPWAYANRRWKKRLWMKLFGQSQLDHAACTLATSLMESDHLARYTTTTQIAPLGLSEEPGMSRADARGRLKIEDDHKVVLYLSRIDRKKGLDLLVEAMADHPQTQLWIVGDGDAEFTRELKQKSRADIRWIGPAWGEARWPYLIAADLFCLPTHSENFGFAILEALWVGTTTLTTSKTPWIEHGEIDGLHICDDNLSSLRDALNSLLPNPNHSPALRDWARSKFHLEVLADRYDEIYHAAVKQ